MLQLFRSSIGRKILAALSGIVLILFLIGHMLGNLQIFAGPDAINSYAEFLHSMPGALWCVRFGLLAIFLLHVVLTIQLNLENAAARPQPYGFEETVKATLASRTMLLSGLVLGFYVIGHLLHFTVGVIYPEYAVLKDAAGRHDVYSMVVKGFQQPGISIAYIVCMALLWSHLSHAVSSVFQTLSLRGPQSAKIIDILGPLVATVIVAGFIAVPAAVLLDIVRLPGGGAL